MPTRNLVDSYEPALDTAINRTSASITINTGDLIVIVCLAVGPQTGADFNITFTHTWTGVTFTQIRQYGTEVGGGTGRRTGVDVQWVKWTGANVSGTYTYNLTDTGERLAQIYLFRYTSAGTVRQSDTDGGDIGAGGSFDLVLGVAPISTSELMVGVAYRPQTPFTHDYVISQSGYSVVADHTADDNAKARILAGAGTIGATATLAFSPDTGDEFDHAAFLLEITHGADEIALVPATVASGGRPATTTLGAAAVSLATAAMVAAGNATEAVPGVLNVSLVKATVATSARVIGIPLTVDLGRPSRQLQARPVTISSTVSVTLGRATRPIQARPVTVSGVYAVALGRRSLALSARPVTVTRGTVTVSLARATRPLSARPVTVTVGATSRTVGRATLHAGARPVAPVVGARTVTLNRASRQIAARPLTLTRGTVTVALARSMRTFVARPVTMTLGPAPSVAIKKATRPLVARPLTITPGAATRTANRATMAAVGRPVLPLGSGITVALGRRSLAYSARPVTATPGARTIQLQRAVVHAGARAQTSTRGPVSMTLAAATMSASPGVVDPDLVSWSVTRIGRPKVAPE